MRQTLALLLFGTAFFVTTGSWAADRTVGVDDQKALGLTVYNGGTAMVRDVRSISLEKGENRLAFEEVSGQIQPETASLKPLGSAKFTLVEQNFDFDLLTPEKLTEKAVGSAVRVIRTNPATGAETAEDATVLSANNGVVLQYKDRIESLSGSGFNGRLVFTKIPENLRARPTLSITLDAVKVATSDVELAYLTGGLTWSADYVANLNPDETRMDLQAWVTMTNSSGTTFRDTTLQLVAGEVHRVSPGQAFAAPPAMALEYRGKLASPAVREELGEYQLYTISRPTTIANQQTKQVGLFEADNVKVKARLEANDYGYHSTSISDEQKIPVRKYVLIENTGAANLGIPMPKGIVRVYQSDSQDRSQFVGEDSIDHTPKNEKADLLLGESFDVTVRRKQTSFHASQRRSRERGELNVYESSYEVTAKNAKSRATEIVYIENFEDEWTVTAENTAHEKRSARRAAWVLKVPAEGESILTFTVQVEVPRNDN
jgi:hypothetical protein